MRPVAEHHTVWSPSADGLSTQSLPCPARPAKSGPSGACRLTWPPESTEPLWPCPPGKAS